jgi:hypothetical protein
MSTSVKHISSEMRGAPTLNGTVGSLLSVLSALLETGWGVTAPISVNVAGGIATATLTSGETFMKHSVVLVEGATPTALNGEARVLTSSSTSITWATTADDGAATGSITIKYAPQTAWEKVFAATNKAVYRSTHIQSAGHFLRIDDSGTTIARVRGYTAMSDIDTGEGPFPTDAQMSGGGYLFKSLSANSSAVKYRIYCDERLIIFDIKHGTSTNATYAWSSLRGFGDAVPKAPGGDAWATLLSCYGASGSNQTAYGTLCGGSTYNFSYGVTFLARSLSGLGGAITGVAVPTSGGATSTSGNDNTFGPAPSAVDGRIYMAPVAITEGTSQPLRAGVPGVRFIPQLNAASVLSDGDLLEGSGDLADRALLCSYVSTSYSTPGGVAIVDLTGPWR